MHTLQLLRPAQWPMPVMRVHDTSMNEQLFDNMETKSKVKLTQQLDVQYAARRMRSAEYIRSRWRHFLAVPRSGAPGNKLCSSIQTPKPVSARVFRDQY